MRRNSSGDALQTVMEKPSAALPSKRLMPPFRSFVFPVPSLWSESLARRTLMAAPWETAATEEKPDFERSERAV